MADSDVGICGGGVPEYISRADDPQPHTHVVIANKVKGENGIWRTLDGRLLYRHQLAAGYLLEDDPLTRTAEALAAQLVDLPIEIIYDLGLAPAVRLVAAGTELSAGQMETLIESCWWAVKR